MEKLESSGLLPADGRRKQRLWAESKINELITPAELRRGRTVGAENVGEDGPEVLVLRQFVDHLCQAAVCHFDEEGQTFGQAGVDQELGHGDGAELQQSDKPNASTGFLQTEHTRHTDGG